LTLATLLAGAGSSSAPSISFAAAPGLGLFDWSGTGDLGMACVFLGLFAAAATTPSLLFQTGATGNLTGVSGFKVAWSSSSSDATVAADSGITRLAPDSLAIGNGTAGDVSGTINFKTSQITATAAAPTSAGTAGTVGQTIMHGGILYFCSVTGSAGAATWNALTMAPV
jgi:hypothetical protein